MSHRPGPGHPVFQGGATALDAGKYFLTLEIAANLTAPTPENNRPRFMPMRRRTGRNGPRGQNRRPTGTGRDVLAGAGQGRFLFSKNLESPFSRPAFNSRT